jgi:hypothetical protein
MLKMARARRVKRGVKARQGCLIKVDAAVRDFRLAREGRVTAP